MAARKVQNKDLPLWRQFQYPFITDVASLQEYVDNGALFVAIDSMGGDVITELAISVLPPSALNRLASGEKPLSDINDLAENYGLDTYSFRVHGKHRTKIGKGLRRGILQFGELQWVNENELVDAVTAKFLSIWNHYAAPIDDGKAALPLVLVGFSMQNEVYQLIQSLKPVLESVPLAACFDIATFFMSMATSKGGANRPSMKLTMQTVGLTFRENTTVEQVAAGQFEDIGWRKAPTSRLHSSGNIAVCELGILVHILHESRPKARLSDTDLSVKMPLLTRLRLLAEVPERPYSGPRKEELVDHNTRKSRLAAKKENASKDMDPDLASTLALFDLGGC